MAIQIVRVITRLNVGGPARHVSVLCNGMVSHGFRTSLLSGSASSYEGSLPVTGCESRFIPSLRRQVNPVLDLRALISLQSHMDEIKPLIVHTHMSKAGALGRLAALKKKIDVVVHTYHGHVLSGYFSRAATSGFVRVERALARRTQALIAVSDEIRDELLSLRVGKPSQWHVIPLGIQVSDFVSPFSKGEARRELGLSEKGLIIGIVGRLTAVKDHEKFLTIGRELVREFPDLRFLIAGDGELRNFLEEKSQAMLGDRVTFLGWVSEMKHVYAALDVVVLTSRREGTPQALIEAAAASRPVVAADVGGVRKVVRDNVTGFLVHPDSTANFVERIAQLLSKPAHRDSMGQTSLSWATSEFSSERMISETAVLYADLLRETIPKKNQA